MLFLRKPRVSYLFSFFYELFSRPTWLHQSPDFLFNFSLCCFHFLQRRGIDFFATSSFIDRRIAFVSCDGGAKVQCFRLFATTSWIIWLILNFKVRNWFEASNLGAKVFSLLHFHQIVYRKQILPFPWGYSASSWIFLSTGSFMSFFWYLSHVHYLDCVRFSVTVFYCNLISNFFGVYLMRYNNVCFSFRILDLISYCVLHFSLRKCVLWMQETKMDHHEDECCIGSESNSKQNDKIVINHLLRQLLIPNLPLHAIVVS